MPRGLPALAHDLPSHCAPVSSFFKRTPPRCRHRRACLSGLALWTRRRCWRRDGGERRDAPPSVRSAIFCLFVDWVAGCWARDAAEAQNVFAPPREPPLSSSHHVASKGAAGAVTAARRALLPPFQDHHPRQLSLGVVAGLVADQPAGATYHRRCGTRPRSVPHSAPALSLLTLNPIRPPLWSEADVSALPACLRPPRGACLSACVLSCCGVRRRAATGRSASRQHSPTIQGWRQRPRPRDHPPTSLSGTRGRCLLAPSSPLARSTGCTLLQPNLPWDWGR